MLSDSIKTQACAASVSFSTDANDALPRSKFGNARMSGEEIANGRITEHYGGQRASTGLFCIALFCITLVYITSEAVAPRPEV